MHGYNSNVGSYRSDAIDDVNVVFLAGGVGGAKLLDNFAQVVPAGKQTATVNTGNEFRHMGLAICSHLDTVIYTLVGEMNLHTGWGRKRTNRRLIRSETNYDRTVKERLA